VSAVPMTFAVTGTGPSAVRVDAPPVDLPADASRESPWGRLTSAALAARTRSLPISSNAVRPINESATIRPSEHVKLPIIPFNWPIVMPAHV
jgi:hypothetical protein